MNKTIARVLSIVLALLMVAGTCAALASCGNGNNGGGNTPGNTDGPAGTTEKTYTYKAGTTSLGTNWNPHSWETSGDSSMLGYITSPFVDMSILDSEKGVYQWVYEMATSIKDITADKQGDLTKYNVTLPKNEDGTVMTPDQVTSGYVYEIKLNPNAAWENGDKITADDYIYSMQMLLHPKFKNYRANLYYSGESAVAGGAAYYNSESPIYTVPFDGETEEPLEYPADAQLYVSLTNGWVCSSDYSFAWMVKNGYIKDAYQVEVD